MKGDISRLVGKQVEIIANGILYKGKLIEIGIDEIFLKSETGWITISILSVTEIRGQGETTRSDVKDISKDFFTREY